jgi:Flp pilus assembly protein TadD
MVQANCMNQVPLLILAVAVIVIQGVGQDAPARPATSAHVAITNPNIAKDLKKKGLETAQEGLSSSYPKPSAALANNRPTSRDHASRGSQLLERHEYQAAIEEFEQALAGEPDNADLHAILGIAYWRKAAEQHDTAAETAAVREFRDALKLRPDDSGVHNNLGLTLQLEGQLKEAESEFETAVKLKPGYAKAYANLGALRREMDDVAGAIKDIETALKLDPANADAHYQLGIVLQQTKQLVPAIAEFREALRLGAQYADVHYRLSQAFKDKGEQDEAKRELQRYLEAHKAETAIFRAQNHIVRGLKLQEEGDLAGAGAELRAAVEAAPESAEAHNNLGGCLFLQRNLDDAMNEFRTALRIDPGFAKAHYNLGLTLWLQGRHDDARGEFEKATESDQTLVPPPEISKAR